MRKNVTIVTKLYILVHAAIINFVIAYTINQRDIKPSQVMVTVAAPEIEPNIEVSFSHFHLYVDRVDDLAAYKSLEEQLNRYDHAEFARKETSVSVEDRKQLWRSLCSVEGMNHCDDIPFSTQNRDIIRQMIAGLGFRVTGYADHESTRTALVTSRDPQGVQIMVTSMKRPIDTRCAPTIASQSISGIHDEGKFNRFMESHNRRQGIGILAFNVNNVKAIYDRYRKLHPALVDSFVQCTKSNVSILEVFAYYEQRHFDTPDNETRMADRGTLLRFVESKDQLQGTKDVPVISPSCTKLGMDSCESIFSDSSMPAYCDHWVSNVFDRTEFISTLADTLGFSPKVDFNAGVVAAGEAQIESTVTGNASKRVCSNKLMALTDQSQVYLPINNAVTSVGHVHGFLEEIGQGVQHVASRVENLVYFVQRCNEYREITGEGFTFLRIPRSYYGILTTKFLIDGLPGDTATVISENCANAIMDCLYRSSFLSKDGALDLYLDRDKLGLALDDDIGDTMRNEYITNRDTVLTTILSSRYCNLHTLLGDSVSEAEYLGIVRNQILIDIQGGDLLYQIFTSNVLQRNVGEEAPFFEFIQRVCSNNVIKPGCGGFGIRNFLTLFLSIEVSKAMQEVVEARDVGDLERQNYAQTMVDYFTDQMNESNPILTQISEAMTEEGKCVDKLAELSTSNDSQKMTAWEARMTAARESKNAGNLRLMECSSRYNEKMRLLRVSTF